MSTDRPPCPDPINLAQIGALAMVGRAAVANWRRRHPDFPAPVGGTIASPQFALAEVRAWLDAHGLTPAGWEHGQALEDGSGAQAMTSGNTVE